MGLYRSASGSHPAPVPRCCGGAARREGVPPCIACSERRRQRVPARQREEPAKSPRATDTERARERRKQHKDWPFPVPVHGGGKGGSAFWASGAWRAAARHSEQSGQILRYGLPQIKKISVFCGQGPVTAPASFAGGEGQVRANSRTAAARARWAGSESGEKRGRGEGRARAVRGKDGAGIYGQAGCRIGPRRKRRLSRRGCAGRQHAGRGESGRVCSSKATQSIGMSRADGSLHTCNDWGPCRRLQKLFPQ